MASYAYWHDVCASPLFAAQHAAKSAHVCAVVPLDPLVPLVPPLVDIAHAGSVQLAEHVPRPCEHVVHSVDGLHAVRHAVSPHAHALMHVRYVPQGPV